MAVDEAFLTVAGIAELLQVTEQTVRNWIERGQLPAVRVGARRVRVRQSDLDAFIAASTTGQAEAGEPESRAEVVADDAELVVLLRSVAQAVTRLADAIERR